MVVAQSARASSSFDSSVGRERALPLWHVSDHIEGYPRRAAPQNLRGGDLVTHLEFVVRHHFAQAESVNHLGSIVAPAFILRLSAARAAQLARGAATLPGRYGGVERRGVRSRPGVREPGWVRR